MLARSTRSRPIPVKSDSIISPSRQDRLDSLFRDITTTRCVPGDYRRLRRSPWEERPLVAIAVHQFKCPAMAKRATSQAEFRLEVVAMTTFFRSERCAGAAFPIVPHLERRLTTTACQHTGSQLKEVCANGASRGVDAGDYGKLWRNGEGKKVGAFLRRKCADRVALNPKSGVGLKIASSIGSTM
jgi:hypothetical protein